MSSQTHPITDDHADMTLAAFLRTVLPDHSWSQVRRLVEQRRVRIQGELCLDPARRLRAGLTLELLDQSAPKPREPETVALRHSDEHLVVAEKPSGMATVRHPSERRWKQERRALDLTLEDVVNNLIAKEEKRPRKERPPRLRIVHRLDKATSGLVVFGRTVLAERGLGKQFAAHTVMRRYLAVIPGTIASQTITSSLIRDRGDGKRGSTDLPDQGKRAVTHVTLAEKLKGYSVVECRLETGRTHQIRIHLSEMGHPVCGERVYRHAMGQEPTPDESGAPRLALHAVELGFEHPATGEAVHWEMPFPPDLREWIEHLRQA